MRVGRADRRLLVGCVGGLQALILAGCFASSGTLQLQTDLDTLQKQVWKLQKDNAALAQQVAQAGSAPDQPVEAMAEMRARLDSLQQEVQVLRTRSEESEQRLTEVSEQLRAARSAIDSMTRSSAPMAASAPGSAQMEPQAMAPPATTPEGAAVAGDDLYRLAYGDYSKGNYDQALAELQEFLRLNPEDDLADDARYLIGEVYFSQQKYPEAVTAYDQLLSDQAAGDKAAAARLKKGLALLGMNRTADAVIQLQYVISNYPKSEEARIARERLRVLGLRER